MTDRLDGKVALVTGGCSGIGLAMVETFVAEGARVVVGDLWEDGGAELERRFAGALRFARCDVSCERDVAVAVALAVEAFGGLDVTCNNAGAPGPREPIEAVNAEQWDRSLAILLRGPMLGIKHSIPAMRARGGGAIINTSSIAGLQGGLGPATYAVAKAGVIQLGRRAALDCAADRIRVNTLCPGFIASPIFGGIVGLPHEGAEAMARELEQAFETLQPLPYGGMPRDIAEAALYLAASSGRFVTGTEIVIDGGLLLKPGLDIGSDAPGSMMAMIQGALTKVTGRPS